MYVCKSYTNIWNICSAIYTYIFCINMYIVKSLDIYIYIQDRNLNDFVYCFWVCNVIECS